MRLSCLGAVEDEPAVEPRRAVRSRTSFRRSVDTSEERLTGWLVEQRALAGLVNSQGG